MYPMGYDNARPDLTGHAPLREAVRFGCARSSMPWRLMVLPSGPLDTLDAGDLHQLVANASGRLSRAPSPSRLRRTINRPNATMPTVSLPFIHIADGDSIDCYQPPRPSGHDSNQTGYMGTRGGSWNVFL